MIESGKENKHDAKNYLLRQAASLSSAFVPVEEYSQTSCLLSREICSS